MNLSNFKFDESPLAEPLRHKTQDVKFDDDYSSQNFSDSDSEKLDTMVDFNLDPRLLEMHKALKANDKQAYESLRKQVTLIPKGGKRKSKIDANVTEGSIMGDINGNMIPDLESKQSEESESNQDF